MKEKLKVISKFVDQMDQKLDIFSNSGIYVTDYRPKEITRKVKKIAQATTKVRERMSKEELDRMYRVLILEELPKFGLIEKIVEVAPVVENYSDIMKETIFSLTQNRFFTSFCFILPGLGAFYGAKKNLNRVRRFLRTIDEETEGDTKKSAVDMFIKLIQSSTPFVVVYSLFLALQKIVIKPPHQNGSIFSEKVPERSFLGKLKDLILPTSETLSFTSMVWKFVLNHKKLLFFFSLLIVILTTTSFNKKTNKVENLVVETGFAFLSTTFDKLQKTNLLILEKFLGVVKEKSEQAAATVTKAEQSVEEMSETLASVRTELLKYQAWSTANETNYVSLQKTYNSNVPQGTIVTLQHDLLEQTKEYLTDAVTRFPGEGYGFPEIRLSLNQQLEKINNVQTKVIDEGVALTKKVADS